MVSSLRLLKITNLRLLDVSNILNLYWLVLKQWNFISSFCGAKALHSRLISTAVPIVFIIRVSLLRRSQSYTVLGSSLSFRQYSSRFMLLKIRNSQISRSSFDWENIELRMKSECGGVVILLFFLRATANTVQNRGALNFASNWPLRYQMISIFKRTSNTVGRLQRELRFGIHGYNGIVSHYLHNVSADQIIHDRRRPLKRTKLICTIGPSSDNPTTAGMLIDEGMNVCRMNFSHGDHAEHLGQMKAVQEALKSRPAAACGFLLDTKGPEVRTGNNEGGKPVFLQKGQLLEITTDYSFLGNNKRIACSYYNLPNATEIGRKILIADGTVQGIVKSIQKGIVTVEVQSDGKVGQKKNMCLPGSPITLPTITETDMIDVMDFALKYKCDQIAVSFTRRGKDLIDLRQMLVNADPVHGRMIQLIAKIENHQGIENIDDIIAAADGIMVARGDLGMEVPLEKVVLCQKYIVDRTIKAGKYVVNATQLLDSMEKRTRPTRAEVADVTNSVYDLVDSTMLSGESANGKFPLEAVGYMRKICQETEYTTDYKALFEERKKQVRDYYAIGAVGLSFATRCSLIFIQIRNNYQIVQRLSALRPRAHICVFTDNPKVASALTLNFGVYCFPNLQATIKKKKLEEFLVTYGRTFAEDKRSPEMALFLSIDETRGYINSQEVVHV